MTTLITPAQAHIVLLILVKAGKFPTITVGEPGAHGTVTTGVQGTGVGTPSLAAVAAIIISRGFLQCAAV